MFSKNENSLLDLPIDLFPYIAATLRYNPAKANLKKSCKFFDEAIRKSNADIHSEMQTTINNYYKNKISGGTIQTGALILFLLACDQFDYYSPTKATLVGLFIKMYLYLTEDYSPEIPQVNGKSYRTISDLVTARKEIETILKESNELGDIIEETLIDEPLVDDFNWICF